MRSNRQIKKFSKQAMDILIRDFDFKRSRFTLETSHRYRKQWPLVWTHWTAPCYWYGESDELSATDVLWDVLCDSMAVYGNDYTECTYPNGKPKQGYRDLIAQARKMAAQKGGA